MSSKRVSTFENLVKPIADPSAGFVRTAISGYFLTFSNLGPDAEFRLLVVIPTFTLPGAPGEAFFDRELTVSDAQGGPQNDPNSIQGNHSIIYDITGGLAAGQTAVGELTFLGATHCAKIYWSDRYELCRGGTAQIALLPNLGPFGPPLLATDLLEIRGWVALGRYPASIISDNAKPRGLVTPEQRGTFLPVGVSSGTDPVDLASVSQLRTSLPVAGGEALIGFPSPGPLPPDVKVFAEENGIAGNEISCFSSVLSPIV
ncbi:MAG: hypothetical protein MI919_03470 [Holophagales bacterium]|nr:hypothetical protein [Holophagales bacterium]